SRSRDRQHAELIASFKWDRSCQRRTGTDLQGRHRLILLEGDGDDPACRPGGLKRISQQAQKRQTLPLGYEIGAIEQGVPKPGEQFDHRSPWIAWAWIRPLRSVRGNSGPQLGNEVFV